MLLLYLGCSGGMTCHRAGLIGLSYMQDTGSSLLGSDHLVLVGVQRVISFC